MSYVFALFQLHVYMDGYVTENTFIARHFGVTELLAL